MTKDEAIKWIDNLYMDISNIEYSTLWTYGTKLKEIKEILVKDINAPNKCKDVVEVVRCKDCKHSSVIQMDSYSIPDRMCNMHMPWRCTDDDWYCPLGERKDEPQTERSEE